MLSARADAQAVAERLLDHHAPPALRLAVAQFLVEQTGVAKLLDHWTEESIGYRQIEQAIAGGLVLTCDVLQMQAEIVVERLLTEVALYVGHATRQALPGRFIDRVDAAFAVRVADEALQFLAQAVAPVVFTPRGDIDTDDGEVLRQQIGMREVVQGRHQQAMRQIAAGAEDHHRARTRKLRLSPWRGVDELRRARTWICHKLCTRVIDQQC